MLLWQIFLNGGRDLKYLRKMSTSLFGLWLAKKKKTVQKCSMLWARVRFLITEFCYMLYLYQGYAVVIMVISRLSLLPFYSLYTV